MKKNIFIFFLISSVIIIIGFFLYINSNSDIPTIYPSDGPIRELPKNTPEVKRPSNIPCIYSLWNNSNEPCGSLENIFEEKKLNVNYFSLLFGTFSKFEDAEIHLKKLKLQNFLKDRIIKIEKILPTNIVINIKKGQFMNPTSMKFAVDKAKDSGNDKVIITERGSMFGYQDLIVDFRGIPKMKEFAPVILDVTHSLQQPNQPSGVTGGNPELIETIAKAGIASGVDGLFIETHPSPENAKSDGKNMLPLEKLENLLVKLLKIKSAI